MGEPTKSELVHQIIPRLSALEKEMEKTAAINEYSHKQYEKALDERLRTDERHEHAISDLRAKQTGTEERCKSLEKNSDRTWQVWLALLVAGISVLMHFLNLKR